VLLAQHRRGSDGPDGPAGARPFFDATAQISSTSMPSNFMNRKPSNCSSDPSRGGSDRHRIESEAAQYEATLLRAKLCQGSDLFAVHQPICGAFTPARRLLAASH